MDSQKTLEKITAKTLDKLEFTAILRGVYAHCIAHDTQDALARICPRTNADEIENERELLVQASLALAAANFSHAPVPPCLELMHAAKARLYTLEELGVLRMALGAAHACLAWREEAQLRHAQNVLGNAAGNISANASGFVDADGAGASSSTASSSLALLAQHLTFARFPRELFEHLARFFAPDGALRTENIEELRALEKARQRVHRERTKTAAAFLQQHASWTASSSPTIRSDRVVLAIEASHRSKISGIVHGSSSSEKSVYVEIPALYELNNEAEQISAEERRVLYDLSVRISGAVHGAQEAMRACYEDFIRFDGLRARLRYGDATGGSLIPVQKTETSGRRRRIFLPGALHPLIQKCDPITIELLSPARQLVITGPNAGGKTAALKTLGLCALMSQSGIPVPLADPREAARCALPVFARIEVVIGDEQDISRGASTFSSHMAQVQEALSGLEESADEAEGGPEQKPEPALLLFDELCAGTDDREGGALGCAILEYLARTNSIVCVTTHSALIKHYALTDDRACCAAFRCARSADGRVVSRSLLYDVPGSSEAAGAARTAGIPEAAFSLYEARMREIGSDYNSMLEALSRSVLRAKAEEQKAQAARTEHEEAARRVKEMEREIAAQKARLDKEGAAEGAHIIADARKILEHASYALSQAKKLNAGAGSSADSSGFSLGDARNVGDVGQAAGIDDVSRDVLRARDELRDVQEKTDALRARAAEAAAQAAVEAQRHKAVAAGDTVRIVPHGAVGTVIDVDSAGEKYRVRAGVLTMELTRGEIELLAEAAAGRQKISSPSRAPKKRAAKHEATAANVSAAAYVKDISADAPPPLTLDVRGLTAADACAALETHLDACALHHVSFFSVIHGKGEGILRRELYALLRRHPLVARYESAAHEDGGAGKTYVYLV